MCFLMAAVAAVAAAAGDIRNLLAGAEAAAGAGGPWKEAEREAPLYMGAASCSNSRPQHMPYRNQQQHQRDIDKGTPCSSSSSSSSSSRSNSRLTRCIRSTPLVGQLSHRDAAQSRNACERAEAANAAAPSAAAARRRREDRERDVCLSRRDRSNRERQKPKARERERQEEGISRDGEGGRRETRRQTEAQTGRQTHRGAQGYEKRERCRQRLA